MGQKQTTTSDLQIYNIFVPQNVLFLKISDDVSACDLWFAPPPPPPPPPPESKILARPMVCTIVLSFSQFLFVDFQMILMRKPDHVLSQCNIGIQILAEKCHSASMGGGGTDVWVGLQFICLSL